MLPIIAGIISSLISNNLPRLAQGVVDKGLDYVEDKIGVKLEPNMSPEKIAEVTLAAQKHEEFLIIEANSNTANARAMQVAALNQNDTFSKRFTYLLASFWSIVAACYIFVITLSTIPLANQRYADTILGFLLGTVIGAILNYFFGSSSGSAAKTDMMNLSKKID